MTDFSQLLGTPAGNIQSEPSPPARKRFKLHGAIIRRHRPPRPDLLVLEIIQRPAAAYHPRHQRHSDHPRLTTINAYQSVTLNLNQMPVVGTYMEGYARVRRPANTRLGAVAYSISNGGLTAFTLGGNTVSTANGLYSHDAWHHFQIDFNFKFCKPI